MSKEKVDVCMACGIRDSMGVCLLMCFCITCCVCISMPVVTCVMCLHYFVCVCLHVYVRKRGREYKGG